MVLVLVLSVLTISYASSLKAYFQQHSQIQRPAQRRSPRAQTSISELESEKAALAGPGVRPQQARARFGYLMPGQTSYVVIGADGKPLAAQATLSDPADHHHDDADRLVDHGVALGRAGRRPAVGQPKRPAAEVPRWQPPG